jgi:hypothetical protein
MKTTNVGTRVYLLVFIFNIGGEEDSLGSLGNFGNFGNLGNINRCNVWGNQSIGMKQTMWQVATIWTILEMLMKALFETLRNGTNYWNLLVTIFLT